MISKLLLVTVFLIPLIGASGVFGYQQAVTFGYEHIKVLVFIISISLISFLWILTKPNFKWTLIAKASGVFILILLITSLTGSNLQNSLLGTPAYFQGWILYAYLFLFYILVKSLDIKLNIWALILTLSASIVSMLAIKDWILINFFSQDIPTYAGRVVSTFGQPNFYSGFILLTLPFWYLLVRKSSSLWLYLVGSILILGIIVSDSRIALILTLSLLVGFLVKTLFKSRWLLFLVIIFSILIGISIGLFSAQVFDKEFKEISSLQWLRDNSPEKRIYIWPIIGELISKRPILGYGLENIGENFSLYFKNVDFNSVTNPVYYSLRDLVVDRSHNHLLDLLMFSGILGLLSWGVLIVLLFKKVKLKILLVSLLVYLVWTLFQNQSVVHLIYLWLLAGLIDRESS